MRIFQAPQCFAAAAGAVMVGALFLTGCAGLRPPPTASAEPGAEAALSRMVDNPCTPVLAQALAGARVPIAQVDGLTYGTYINLATGNITMYDAWVSLKGQPGALIVQMDDTCYLRQVYSRGGAKLPQVAEW